MYLHNLAFVSVFLHLFPCICISVCVIKCNSGLFCRRPNIAARPAVCPCWIEAVGEEVESCAFNLYFSKSTFILSTTGMGHKSQTLDLTNLIILLNSLILNTNSWTQNRGKFAASREAGAVPVGSCRAFAAILVFWPTWDRGESLQSLFQITASVIDTHFQVKPPPPLIRLKTHAARNNVNLAFQ